MGAACSSEETSHKSPVQESVTLVVSQSKESVNRKGDMSRKMRSRTVSVINTETYDLLKVRHPELTATLAEFDNVTTTLKAKKGNVSTENDYRNIYKLLDEKVDDMFMEYAEQEQRLLMGNYLAKNGFIPVLVEIYKQVFHDHDLEAFEDDVADEDDDATYFLLLKLIRTILWNFGDGSADFGLAIVNETDMLTYLLEDLFAVEDDMKYFENINNTNHFPFNSTLGIINNCARSGINRNVYKMKRLKKDEEVHMVDILESILKTEIKYVKLVTLLALSYIVNEQQNKKLSADESIFVFLLDIIKKAEKAKDHRQFGFSIQELVNGLANLARNDENKTRIMDKDAYPILKSILKKGDEAEQCAVVRALWELSFIKKNRDKFKKDNELLCKLQSLRESDNESLAKAAQGACFVIDQDSAANAKKVQEVSAAVSKDAGHVMLSYNWGDQKTLLKIRDRLIKCGLTIWMDVDNMEGSILEAMATAVEDASVVLICYSEKYKDSQNCRTDGKITKILLKTRSGEFDVESIHSLNLRDCGISDLGCVSECTQLERLNLSRNDISKLNKLAGLGNLCVLNLSANRITSLEGLQALENLRSVNLAGNLIGSVNCLRVLTALDKLEELRLHDSVRGLTNPICQSITYRKDVMDMLPNLKVLDGERLLGHGSDVFLMLRQIDDALEKRQEISSQRPTQPQPWVSDEYFDPPTSFEESNLSDAKEQLEALLSSCKMAVDKSEEMYTKLQQASESPT